MANAWKTEALGALVGARERLLGLLAPLSEEALTKPHSPLMSPLIWDVAHVANYEEQWLLRSLGEGALVDPEFDALYDAFRHPRATRAELPILAPAEAFRYAAHVRERVLKRLEQLPEEQQDPLLRAGFVYGMVAQHEQQHIETLLATLQLMECFAYAPPAPVAPPFARWSGPREVFVPGGAFAMGSADPWAYDNERPVHPVEVSGFWLDTVLVTNGDFITFMEDGGYARPELWPPGGFERMQREAIQAPLFWRRDGRSYLRRRFSTVEAVPADEPVQHVCWYEAAAYARWAQKRLPTEPEWERAFAWQPGCGSASDFISAPDERSANLGQRYAQPLPATASLGGARPCGALQMLGDVWEWTASDFAPYPGYQPFPYREYSEVFWGGGYKVLRGGAWGVAPVAVRPTFRNWDHPQRRQIFAGFRCARDQER